MSLSRVLSSERVLQVTVKAITIDPSTQMKSEVVTAEYVIEGSLGVQAHAQVGWRWTCEQH